MGAGVQRWWRGSELELECLEWRYQEFRKVDQAILHVSRIKQKEALAAIRRRIEALRLIGTLS